MTSPISDIAISKPPKWSSVPWTAAEILLNEGLSTLAARKAFESKGLKGQIAFRPFETDPLENPGALLGLGLGSRTALLGLPDWSLVTLHPLGQGLDPARLPFGLKLALLESLAEPLLADLSKALGERVFLDEPPALEWPTSGRFPRFSLAFSGKDLSFSQSLTLVLPQAADRRLLLARLSELEPPKTSDFKFLSLPMGIVVGALALLADEVKALAPGDLLIPDRPPILAGKGFLEYPGLRSWALDLSPGQALITSTLNAKETFVEDPKAATQKQQTPPASPSPASTPPASTPKAAPSPAGPAQASPAAPLALPGELELPLRFEIGRRMMALKDLETLAPGQVIPVFNDPNQSVTVTCHGQALAQGALVDLGDGRLGVQLTVVGQAAGKGAEN
ncbi:MAG: type III secretion system cytoplasmic ring protein SctQ [Deltaproteobacteria bacterium]|jgi:type III secretion system YscQ/HrcQ family protein|nr:type III secretion system cytoplasmic ring protein SctQ [Deltaproteobacteria bacterium]